ncbi:MAG TPA: guanylate kinase [Ruminococcaceae bacterium]|nr:guanylate kinase [Oscillospiraceae bacterium]
MNKPGQVFIISGPSGSGKDTLIKALMEKRPEIKLSVSSVTRAPRPGELNGSHYNFITKDEFLRMLDNGEFLEYNTYLGNYYGTPRAQVEAWLQSGADVILEIDVNGAGHVKKKLPDAVSIFVMPPSMRELGERLAGRRTEDEETAQKRLLEALREMECAGSYDYIIINDRLQNAVRQLECVVEAQGCRAENMTETVKGVLKDAQSVNWQTSQNV